MRIPLTRDPGDETPTAWWEWLFAPIMLPLFLIMMFVLGVVEIIGRLVVAIRESKLTKRLQAMDRYLDWPRVEAHLKAAQGTLIVDWIFPNGRLREWWTPDDLVRNAPFPISKWIGKDLPKAGEPLNDYARHCLSKYTDIENGVAKLTNVPCRQVLHQYSVVTLIAFSWDREPVILLGYGIHSNG